MTHLVWERDPYTNDHVVCIEGHPREDHWDVAERRLGARFCRQSHKTKGHGHALWLMPKSKEINCPKVSLVKTLKVPKLSMAHWRREDPGFPNTQLAAGKHLFLQLNCGSK